MNPYLKKSGILIRLLSMFYDICLLIGVLFLFGLLFAFFAKEIIFSENTFHWLYKIYLNSLIFIYFFFFLWKQNQTPGMKICRLYLLDCEQKPIDSKKLIIRLLIAYPSILFFGLGFFFACFNKERKTLYDHFSQSYIYRHHRT